MNTLLDQAIAEVRKLSPEEQDSFARWMLAELANVQQWNKEAQDKADSMEWFAEEALEGHGNPRSE
ncbi:MAG TPA: hypothetical protein VHD90_18225 [Phototrophicaceae bacterium]|nr:hypothetical protein [Phototrophicaceae bacterium]